PMYMSIASNSACGGAPMPSSIFTNPMKRGMLINPPGWWELLSRTYVEPRGGTSTSTSEVFQIDREVLLASREPAFLRTVPVVRGPGVELSVARLRVTGGRGEFTEVFVPQSTARRSIPTIVGVGAVSAALVLSASGAQAAGHSFLGGLSHTRTVASTVPQNGDVNPYGVAVVRRTMGR